MDLSAYKEAFLEAARDHIASVEQDLNKLSQNPTDSELISSLHRYIHSTGSQNYAMGFTSTGAYLRVIEAYFYKIKKGEVNFKPEKAQIINEALTKVKDSLNNIETSDKENTLEADEKDLEEKLNS